MSEAAPPSGPGGTSPRVFSERLWPSPATWLLVVLGAGFGAATGYVGGPGWAVAGGAALAAVVVVALVRASTVVSLSAEGVLRVDRARIEVAHLTGAVAARGEEAQGLRGPLLDGRTHLCLRGWVDPVVLVGLGDPADPTPSWLFSTRRPEQLVRALAAQGVSGPVAVHRPASSARDAPGSTTPHPELGSERGMEGR